MADSVLKPKSSVKPRPQFKKRAPRPAHVFILCPNNIKRFLTKSVKRTLHTQNIYHKIRIQNTNPPSSRLSLLRAIIKQVDPHILIPVHIQLETSTLMFYCSNCGPALVKLCENELYLNFTYQNKVSKLPITLYTAVRSNDCPKNANPSELIKAEIEKKVITSPMVIVNLPSFDKFPGMNRKFFLDLSNPIYFKYVMMLLKSFNPNKINLAHNNLESLIGCKIINTLHSINLSDNQIKSLDDLGMLLKLKLKEINLSDNPIRNEFSSKEAFEEKLKELFPDADVIDSGTHKTKFDPLINRPSFAVSQSAVYFVDQFMEHYFTLYDNPNKRRHLREMYHSMSLLTVSSNILEESENDSNESPRYKHQVHNLLQSKYKTGYTFNNHEIIEKICYLPLVEHDPYTFIVDIMDFTENVSAMFIIYGSFREQLDNHSVYFFQRTFRLIGSDNGEYKIVNDLLHISNYLIGSTNYKPFNSIKFKNQENIDLSGRLPLPLITRKDQKDCITALFVEITFLHVEFALRFLEQADWDLRRALEMFVYELTFDVISPECFIQDEVKSIVFSLMPTIEPGFNREKLGQFLENMQNLMETKYCIDKGKNNKKHKFLKEMLREVKLMLLQGIQQPKPMNKIKPWNLSAQIEHQNNLQFLLLKNNPENKQSPENTKTSPGTASSSGADQNKLASPSFPPSIKEKTGLENQTAIISFKKHITRRSKFKKKNKQTTK